MTYRSDAKEVTQGSSLWLLAFLILFLGVTAISVGAYYFVAPVKVAIDNRVFHASQPYNDGMRRELADFRLQYAGDNDAQKAVIQGTVRHDFAGYDTSTLDPADRAFVEQMLGGQ